MFERHKDTKPGPLPPEQKVAMAIVVIAIVGLAMIGVAAHNAAHGTNLNHQWDSSPYHAQIEALTDAEGHSCCNQGDMNLLHTTEDWKMEDGKYWVRLFDHWWEVPDAAAHMNGRVPEAITHGKAVVWYRTNTHREGGEALMDAVHIYCFQAGLMA